MVDTVESVRREIQLSVFAVGVGPAVVANELRGISGIRQSDGSFRQEENVSWFRSPNFARVSELVTTIVTQVCEAAPTNAPQRLFGKFNAF